MKGKKVTIEIYGKTITGIVTDYDEKANWISINNGDYRMTIDYFNEIKV